AERPTRSAHARFAQLLGSNVSGSEKRVARPVSEASVARGSMEGDADAARQTTRTMTARDKSRAIVWVDLLIGGGQFLNPITRLPNYSITQFVCLQRGAVRRARHKTQRWPAPRASRASGSRPPPTKPTCAV